MPVPGKRVVTVLGFATLHAVLAFGSMFLGDQGRFAVTGHHEIFFKYASEALMGHLPYRDYLVEYPILSFPVMLAPRLVASDQVGYSVGFIVMLLGFNGATVALVAGRVERDDGLDAVPGALGWYTLFFVALCPLLLGPFDLAPTFLGFAAACGWAAGRDVGGGILAGLGVLMKVFPGVVAIPGMILDASRLRQTQGRGTIAVTLTVALGMALWFGVGGRGVMNSFEYHAERGLQVESTWAGLVFLYGVITGRSVTWTLDHSAAHVTDEWGSGLARLAIPAQCLTFLVVAWRFRRSGLTEFLRATAAGILGFIVFGKVLSPQFMIWLIPFIASLRGRVAPRARRVFLACCVMSSMSFPWGVLLFLLNGYRWAVLFLNIRNALLVYLLFLLLFGPRDPSKETSNDV